MPESEQSLLVRYRNRGDLTARDELARRLESLARHIASGYGTRELHDDVLAVASLGLAEGIERYDEARGVPLRIAVLPTMVDAVHRYLDDATWSRRPPCGEERMEMVARVAGELSTSSPDPVTVDDIARALSLRPEDVLEALRARRLTAR
jgi:DNA-directed RNA polymerase specialized sigma subunit